MLLKKILIIFILYVTLLSVNASDFNPDRNVPYCLTFHSYTHNQDEKTGLDLTPDSYLKLTPGTSMEFMLRFNNINTYGYVFRVVLNDTLSLDFLSNFDKINLVLVGKQNVFVNEELKANNIIKDKEWLKINVQFNKEDISISANNKHICKLAVSINNYKKSRIYFGRNNHPNFHVKDVPPISVRDIIIRNPKGKTIRHWKLHQHNNNVAYDIKNNHKAIAEHGIWEIDNYVKWKKVKSIPIYEAKVQISFDAKSPVIFIATQDSLRIYDIKNDIIEKTRNIDNSSPIRSGGGSQMIYDDVNNRLISYSIMSPKLSIYDFETKIWSHNFIEILPPLQQHNRFIDKKNGQLIIFGGYGMYRYSGKLYKHNLIDEDWDEYDMSQYITPRYLSSMGYLGETKLLVMGGHGTPSGRQEDSPNNLYDLFVIDYDINTCKKIMQFEPVKSIPITFSNSMIIKENNIYAIAFNNGRFNSDAFLFSLDMNTAEVKILGDTIQYKFNDQESFCDLFLHEETSTIYSIMLEIDKGQYVANVYSLAFPPLRTVDIIGNTQEKSNLVMYLLCCVLICFAIFFIYRRICFSNKRDDDKAKKLTEDNTTKETTVEEPLIEQTSKNSMISLLGGFTISDRNGKDITENFSPITKQIFIYILINSLFEKKRVTSQKLDETFWSGMDKSNALNNRSVNIRKLRIAISEIGNVTISNKNSSWFLDIGENVVCDYYVVVSLLRKIKQNKVITKNDTEQILEFASKGTLLPEVNADWIDKYKSDYSSKLTDFLLKAITNENIKDDLELLLRISNVLFLFDSIDEDAVRIKCRVLYLMGQKGASKQCYDKFVEEYKELLNAKPDFEYNDIIELF